MIILLLSLYGFFKHILYIILMYEHTYKHIGMYDNYDFLSFQFKEKQKIIGKLIYQFIYLEKT